MSIVAYYCTQEVKSCYGSEYISGHSVDMAFTDESECLSLCFEKDEELIPMDTVTVRNQWRFTPGSTLEVHLAHYSRVSISISFINHNDFAGVTEDF